MHRLVPFLGVLFLCTTPAYAGIEKRIGDVLVGPKRASFARPSVATDGSTFLAAWVESGNSEGRLMVKRLDDRDPLPRPLVFGSGLVHGDARLVWTGSSYLVVFTQSGLRSIRVDRAGNPIEGSGRLIAADGSPVAIASRGMRTVIVVSSFRSNDVVAYTLDESDLVVRKDSLLGYSYPSADVAAIEGGFGIALSSYEGLSFIRMDENGVRRDDSPIVLMPASDRTTTAYRPGAAQVVAAGSGAVVVWSARTYATPSDLYTAVIDSSGKVHGPHKLEHRARYVSVVDVIRTESGFRVVLIASDKDLEREFKENDFELLTLNSRADAVVEIFRPVPSIRNETAAAVAQNANATAVVMVSRDENFSDARIEAIVEGNLKFEQPRRLLSAGVMDQADPDIAGDGSHFVVAWLEQVLDRQRIVAALVDRDGNRVSEVLSLRDAHFSYTSAPKVFFAHGAYLVAWTVEASLWGVRVASDGKRIDAEPIRLSGDSRLLVSDFDVTSSSTGFMVVWSENGILGAELTNAGVSAPRRLTRPLAVPEGFGSSEGNPQIAFDGKRYLLAYRFTEYPPCFFPACPSESKVLITTFEAGGVATGAPLTFEQNRGTAISDAIAGASSYAVHLSDSTWIVSASSFRLLATIPRMPDARGSALVKEDSGYLLLWMSSTIQGRSLIRQRRISESGIAGPEEIAGAISSPFAFRAHARAGDTVMATYAYRVREMPFGGASQVFVQILDRRDPQVPSPRRRGAIR